MRFFLKLSISVHWLKTLRLRVTIFIISRSVWERSWATFAYVGCKFGKTRTQREKERQREGDGERERKIERER